MKKIIFVLIFLIVHTACSKLEKVLMVSTKEVTNIVNNFATASGQIVDMGEGATQFGHCFSKYPNVSVKDSVTYLGIPMGTGYFVSQLVNLESGSKYYIKAYIRNGNQIVYGKETSFFTASSVDETLAPPAAITQAATLVTKSTVTLNGSVNGNNFSTIVTFEYGSTSSHDLISPVVQNPVNGSLLTDVSADITGLTSNRSYHFRIKAVSSEGTSYGSEMTFTTSKY